MPEKEFIDFGYTKEEYNLIRYSYSIGAMRDETLIIKFREINNCLLELGYTKGDIIKIVKAWPSLYGFNLENINQRIKDMKSLGYTEEDIIKMIKSFPPLYGLSMENIKQKIVDIISLGYTKEEVIKMTKLMPSLYGSSIEYIKQRIGDMESLGYTKEEIIKMTILLPALYCYSIDNIKQKIEDIIYLGYTKEEVIKMTISLTSLYSYNIENIKQKMEFYDLIDLRLVATLEPKHLMQSTALSYARYNYYLSQGIDINIGNYAKLFNNNKRFEKAYGITKEELLSMYNYDEYLAENEILNSEITDMEIYNTALLKKSNFVLDYLKVKGFNKIDSIESQKEIEKIMIKKMFK